MASDYEKKREETIARNSEVLKNLMASVDLAAFQAPASNKKAELKRKRSSPAKAAKNSEDAIETVSRRSSARLAKIDLNDEAEYREDDEEDESDEEDEVKPKRQKRDPNAPKLVIKKREWHGRRQTKLTKKGRPDPKIFGEQVNTKVGDWWSMRIQCSQAGVHAPTVAGISGNAGLGVWSIVLSGGYPEDVDLGYSFTYTGCGGRDLKGTKNNPKNLRTAPQTFDQSFDNPLNAALKTSVDTGLPVRVVRGFKNQSPFAPEDGYRYDGLYVVKRAWLDDGDSGFKVCRFALVRSPDQDPLIAQKGREKEAMEIISQSCPGAVLANFSDVVEPGLATASATTASASEVDTPVDGASEVADAVNDGEASE